MSGTHEKIPVYAFGHKGSGIVIVALGSKPNVVTIDWASIQSYAADEVQTADVDQVYLDLCAAVSLMMYDLAPDLSSFKKMDSDGVEALSIAMTSSGSIRNNADLALFTNMAPGVHDELMYENTADDGTVSRRKGYNMLHNLVKILEGESLEVPHKLIPTETGEHDH